MTRKFPYIVVSAVLSIVSKSNHVYLLHFDLGYRFLTCRKESKISKDDFRLNFVLIAPNFTKVALFNPIRKKSKLNLNFKTKNSDISSSKCRLQFGASYVWSIFLYAFLLTTIFDHKISLPSEIPEISKAKQRRHLQLFLCCRWVFHQLYWGCLSASTWQLDCIQDSYRSGIERVDRAFLTKSKPKRNWVFETNSNFLIP